MCPPAASSPVRSRAGLLVSQFPVRGVEVNGAEVRVVGEPGDESPTFPAGGGWHPRRAQKLSANTMRAFTARIPQNVAIPPLNQRIERNLACKVLGIVLLNRVCGQVYVDSLDDFERWGNAVAYVFPRGYRHERWSYGRVARLAYQFARELEARNIVEGDAVLLWSPNCAEWVAAFLGCALCGVIAVPVDDAAAPDFARRISSQVRTRLVLCPRERAQLFDSAGMATIDPADLAAVVALRPAERFRPAPIQPSDTLEIVFTSGTTAEPKGVVLTHANVVGNLAPIATEIRKYLKYERLVHPHSFPQLAAAEPRLWPIPGNFSPPLLGATVVFENTFNPTEIIATIHRERVSVLVAVPRMVESLKQKIERDLEEPAAASEFSPPTTRPPQASIFFAAGGPSADVRRQFGWKFLAIISGGAALDRETEEFWHRLGYAVIQGYGLTETTSLISLNHPFHTSRGSIGKVLPGREMRLADDGEILVRGSGVASGYWNGRELHARRRATKAGIAPATWARSMSKAIFFSRDEKKK